MASEITPQASADKDTATSPSSVNWSEHIPADYKAEKFWEPLNGKPLGDVLKGYAESQKLLGRSIQLPQDTSKPEEFDRIYNRLGRPEKPDGYAFEKPANLPEGVVWDDNAEKAFRDFAHKQGLTQSQAQAALGYWNEQVAGIAQAGKITPEQGIAALEKELGKDAKKTVERCQVAVAELFDDEFAKFLDESTLGNHPVIIKALSKLGAMIEEDKAGAGDHGVSGELSPYEAKAEIARIRNDKTHPYHKGDRTAVGHMDDLYRQAYPDSGVVATTGIAE